MSKAIGMEPRREPLEKNGSPSQAETDARLESLDARLERLYTDLDRMSRLVEQANTRLPAPAAAGPSGHRLSMPPVLLAAGCLAIGGLLAGAASLLWRTDTRSETAPEPSAPPRSLQELAAGAGLSGMLAEPAAPPISSWALAPWQPVVEVRHLPPPVLPAQPTAAAAPEPPPAPAAQPPHYQDIQPVDGYIAL
ncbi:MAG: hypothetical protein HYT90_05905 [Candidatus Omnitrophica bacterium]|nr:hypothetical protein [Candidatus Omnitrophota bacterium]